MFVKPARRRAQDQFGDESPKQIEAHENIRRKHKRGKPSIALLMLRKLRKFFADRYDRFGPARMEDARKTITLGHREAGAGRTMSDRRGSHRRRID